MSPLPALWAALVVVAALTPRLAPRGRAQGRPTLPPSVVAVVAVLLGVLSASPWPVAAGLAVVAVPRARRRRRTAAATAAATDALGPALDLVVVALRAGASPTVALAAPTEHLGPVLGPAWWSMIERRRAGASSDAAVRPVSEVLPERGPQLGRLLDVAATTGAPLADALERMADDVRRQSTRTREERVRRLPVLMLGPLVLCILPATVALVVVPVAGARLADLFVASPDVTGSFP